MSYIGETTVGARMAGRAADLAGAAHLTLADGVVHLDPATVVFEAML